MQMPDNMNLKEFNFAVEKNISGISGFPGHRKKERYTRFNSPIKV